MLCLRYFMCTFSPRQLQHTRICRPHMRRSSSWIYLTIKRITRSMWNGDLIYSGARQFTLTHISSISDSDHHFRQNYPLIPKSWPPSLIWSDHAHSRSGIISGEFVSNPDVCIILVSEDAEGVAPRRAYALPELGGRCQAKNCALIHFTLARNQ